MSAAVLCALACSDGWRLLSIAQGLWTPLCQLRSHILVSPKGEFYTLRMSNLVRFKVGFAVARARPERTSSASQGARMLLLLPQAFLCVLHLSSMLKNFCLAA